MTTTLADGGDDVKRDVNRCDVTGTQCTAHSTDGLQVRLGMLRRATSAADERESTTTRSIVLASWQVRQSPGKVGVTHISRRAMR